jgi:hypothetical protein
MTQEELRVSVVAEFEDNRMSSDIKVVIELAKKEPIREFDFNNSDIREFYSVLLKTSNEMANDFGLGAGDGNKCRFYIK